MLKLNRRICIAAMSLSLAVIAGSSSVSTEAAQPSDSAALLTPLLPAVVDIDKYTSADPNSLFYFYGSGFIIDPSGVIITNHHVVKNAVKIVVSGHDLPPLEAKVLFVADWLDLAVLKVEAGKLLPVLQWGDSDNSATGLAIAHQPPPIAIGAT